MEGSHTGYVLTPFQVPHQKAKLLHVQPTFQLQAAKLPHFQEPCQSHSAVFIKEVLLLSFPRKHKLPEAAVPVARMTLEHQNYAGSAFSMLIHGGSKPWLCFSVHLSCSSWFLNSFFHPDWYFQLEPFYTRGWR